MNRVKKSKWTPVFLLLAAALLAVTPVAGPATIPAFCMAGILLILGFVFALRSNSDGRITRRGRFLLFFLFAVVFGITAVSLFTYLRYRPPLIAAPGYTLRNVTEPGLLDGRIKTFQTFTEQIPCTYQLLGWEGTDTLYYEAACDGTRQSWRYTVATGKNEPVSAVPDALYAETIPATAVTNSVLADVYPRELATVSREIFIAGDALPAPDGRFTAFVSRHVYGPQDVLLVGN